MLTNPAGMTRLAGSQLLLVPQVLYGKVNFTVGSGTSPQLGTDNGGNAVGWFPGGGAFFSYSVTPDLKLGFAASGNFGLSEGYQDAWVGRLFVHDSRGWGLLTTHLLNPNQTGNCSLPWTGWR